MGGDREWRGERQKTVKRRDDRRKWREVREGRKGEERE